MIPVTKVAFIPNRLVMSYRVQEIFSVKRKSMAKESTQKKKNDWLKNFITCVTLMISYKISEIFQYVFLKKIAHSDTFFTKYIFSRVSWNTNDYDE